MTPNKSLTPYKHQKRLFLLLITSAYATSIGFGLYYYLIIGSKILFLNCVVAFSIHLLAGATSFLITRLTFLFRISIFTALAAFFVQTYFSGGVVSPSMSQFVATPLLAFFYRPVKDRYFFLIASALCMLSMWPLTVYGYTENHIDEAYQTMNSTIVTIFVFIIIMIYSFLYKGFLTKKNQELRRSLTELKATTQKLVQSEKMASLGIMSAGVAHEINNPLNFIKGGVDLLYEKLGHSSEHVPYLKAIEEGVKRASSIVHGMRHFSRSTSSMDEECDLHAIIENCLVMLQHRFKYRVKITKDYADSRSLNFIGNEGKIHQAILNIFSNAEQAIKGRGEIIIKTKAKKKNIILIISDSGEGISEENLKRISDPFFTTKPIGEGTGLGLAISYQIIHEHGGKVSVVSRISIGTEFTITLPLNKRFH